MAKCLTRIDLFCDVKSLEASSDAGLSVVSYISCHYALGSGSISNLRIQQVGFDNGSFLSEVWQVDPGVA